MRDDQAGRKGIPEHSNYAFRSTRAGRDRGTTREIRFNYRNACTQARMVRSDRLILEQDLTRDIR